MRGQQVAGMGMDGAGLLLDMHSAVWWPGISTCNRDLARHLRTWGDASLLVPYFLSILIINNVIIIIVTVAVRILSWTYSTR